jgi:sigma-54 dependent transcriptional regulator, acetoin dehydrogenase operon transcriptional activator AcoR
MRKKLTSHPLYTISDIVGSCPKMTEIRRIVKKAALTTFPIIVYGESGTGKELIAQSLHTSGPRGDQPFIAVNCSAIPENLIESELFGYEKGAFTGANREGVMGKFEAANGGTIFLDEIGDMSLKAQAVLC